MSLVGVGVWHLSTTPKDGLTFKDIATPVIASLSLLFTLATFWWNNWRRGRLIADHPRSFAVRRTRGRTLLTIPLVLQNTGARTLSVVALRLRTATGQEASYSRLHAAMDLEGSSPSFATGFVVGGRDSALKVCEFDTKATNFLTAGQNEFYLDVLFSRKKKWMQGRKITLHVDDELFSRIGNDPIAIDNSRTLSTAIAHPLLSRRYL